MKAPLSKLKKEQELLLSSQSEDFKRDVAGGLDAVTDMQELERISNRINQKFINNIKTKRKTQPPLLKNQIPLWLIAFVILLLVIVVYLLILFNK